MPSEPVRPAPERSEPFPAQESLRGMVREPHFIPDPELRVDQTRLAFRVLIVTALAQALFASWPELDIWVSALFYDPVEGFALRENELLRDIRYTLIYAVWIVGIPAFFMMIATNWGPGPYRTGPRPWAFASGGLILGAGILVNGVLKSLWGRARPADIVEFGGTQTFTPAFRITDQCARNCSFTSGEAASISSLVLIALVLGWPMTGRYVRWGLVTVLLPIAIGGSALRVMTGRHFLSDVLFSILLCGLIIIWLYWLLRMERYRGMTLGDLLADLMTAARDTYWLLRGGRKPPPVAHSSDHQTSGSQPIQSP